MKISIFLPHLISAAQQENLPLEMIFEKAGAMGYQGIEGDYNQILGMLPQLQKMLMDHAMEFSSVYSFQHFERGYEEAPLLHMLDTLCTFPCKKLMLVPGFFTEESKQEVELVRIVDGISFVCEAARERGITVSVEDFGNAASPCFTTEGLLFLLDQIPLLQYTFDTGNFYFAHEDPLAAFSLLRHRLAHVHMKDYSDHPLLPEEAENTEGAGDCKGHPVPVGSGFLPVEACLRAICETGYDDFLAVEQFGCAHQLDAMKKSIDFIRARL